MSTKEKKSWLISPLLQKKSRTQKIAYIAVMTALCVAFSLFEIPTGMNQFSLSLFMAALSGIIIGPSFGFVAAFLADVVGFLYAPKPPFIIWLSLSMGLTAFISGFFISVVKGNGKKWLLYIKLTLISIFTFLLCTVLINTTALWSLFGVGKGYWAYLTARLLDGQLANSVVNYVLLFITVPILNLIKPLNLEIV